MIADLSIKAGTTLSATGGTDVLYGPNGTKVDGGICVIDKSVSITDERLRPTITFQNKAATLNSSTQVWSKTKRTVKLSVPHLDVNNDNRVEFSNGWIEVAFHPSLSAAEQAEFWKKMAQFCFDAQLAAFREYGDIS